MIVADLTHSPPAAAQTGTVRVASPANSPTVSLAGLRTIALLQDLDDAVLAEVAAACRFQRVRARQTVMSRADAGHDCCFVIAGRLRAVALSPLGREVSFRDVGAGETIGEMAALDGRPRSATVVALQESLLARLPAAELRTLLHRHWPICERMLHHLAGTARALTERVYELSALSVPQRLCAELLRLAATGVADGAARVVLRPAPSHGEIARRIGSGREQVARAMGELARRGVVQRERETDDIGARDIIVIADPQRLVEAIEGEPSHAGAAIDRTLCAGAQAGTTRPA